MKGLSVAEWVHRLSIRATGVALSLMICTQALAATFVIPEDRPWSEGTLEGLVTVPEGLALAPGVTRGSFEGPVWKVGERVDRVVPFWNTKTGSNARAEIYARLLRNGQPICGWILVSTWSRGERGKRDSGTTEVTLSQDTLETKTPIEGVQLKVVLSGSGAILEALGASAFASDVPPKMDVDGPGSEMKIPVGYRSQRSANPAISSRVCGPTSLSMALQFHGVDLSIDRVAELAKDPGGPITYGNWAYLAATAAELGLATQVTVLPGISALIQELSQGNPVIIPIRFEAGQLTGAPISRTSGHLILVRGYDAEGNLFVNDPAGHNAGDGQIRYKRDQIARVWRHGVAIFIRPGARLDRSAPTGR